MSTLCVCLLAGFSTMLGAAEPADILQGAQPSLANVVPPVLSPEHFYRGLHASPWQLPLVVPPFEEHVRAVNVPQPQVPVAGIAFDTQGLLIALGEGGAFA